MKILRAGCDATYLPRLGHGVGAGLVVADQEEVVVSHALEAGDEVAVVIVVNLTLALLKGGRPGDTPGGGSIVCSDSGPRQQTG